jgi:ATP-binding cassette subfamily B protein
LVVAGEKIAESGTHDELLGKDGIYRNFVTAREKSRDWSRRAAQKGIV